VTGPRLSVCLTFDFDALSPWAFGMAGRNVAALSRGEFGAVAVPRILALLERRGIRATFFVPGHTALAYPELVRQIRDAGHELGHHGWVHEPLSLLEPDRERELLRRGLDALDRVAGVRPVGYRAPSVDVSPATVEILLEHGFIYDASFSGSDFEPYYLRSGDRFPPDGEYVFGENVDLVGIPFSWSLSDFQYFEFVPGVTGRQDAPSTVYEIWLGELRWAHANVAGGVFDLCMHPQAIGRGPRLAMLERLIDAAAGLDGVAFERLGDYAARWRDEHPLGEWRRNGSVHARRIQSAVSREEVLHGLPRRPR
jgi:peptidoglycan/xylan/chitin deacetylase (PgdA/CDA1 family)